MRYQERIYPQTNVSALRNKYINIFNESSDICIFNAPNYYIIGAGKVDCDCIPCSPISGVTPTDIYGNLIVLPTAQTYSYNVSSVINLAELYYNTCVEALSPTTYPTCYPESECMLCGRALKIKTQSPFGALWIVCDSNGLGAYYITDITDAQNTINNITYSLTGSAISELTNLVNTLNTDLNSVYPEIEPYELFWNSTGGCVSCCFSASNHTITGTSQTIPLNFVFTSNTTTFTANTAIFNYKLFKYEENTNAFNSIPSYVSEDITYTSLTNSATTQLIPSSGLTLDSEYIIKGFFKFSACTEYMNKLGSIIDTSRYVGGTEYGIYNKNLDYYISVVEAAATPQFNYNASNSVANGALQQAYLPINFYTIYPDIDPFAENIDGEDTEYVYGVPDNTIIGIPADIDTPFIITLNGLVLALDVDYTYSGGTIVYMNAPLVPEDIVTIIYTSSAPNTITNDIFEVTATVPSGATNTQGSYSVFFNTTTSKFELFTSAKPIDFSKVLVMINGVVLANGVDFYQSTSNPRRIILNGDLVLNDIITISYFPDGVVGNVITQLPTASWSITPPPKKVNGYFTFQLATDINFTNIVYSSTTDYYIDIPFYSIEYPLSGYTYGDRLFYRVKNDKNYETICGKIVNSYAYSDTIPITIASNTINSY